MRTGYKQARVARRPPTPSSSTNRVSVSGSKYFASNPVAITRAAQSQDDATNGNRMVRITAHRIPHDFRRTGVRNLERVSVSRSVGMKMTGHKTESMYRRYAIVGDTDLREAVMKLAQAADVGRLGTKTAEMCAALVKALRK